MGQYSRAFVVAHTNVLLDFEKDLRGTIQARMYNAAFTCFYVELLMFEEAAQTCFNKEAGKQSRRLWQTMHEQSGIQF